MWIKSEEVLQLKNKIKELEEELKMKKSISFLLDETIPIEENQRKIYMADISLFYEKIFKNKLKHFIGSQMSELAQFGRSEKWSDFLKASINVFRIIDEWMELRTNEHLGDLEEMRNRFQDDKEFINNFNKTYGEN